MKTFWNLEEKLRMLVLQHSQSRFSCEIEAITSSGDFVNAYEFGDPSLFGTTASGNNTQEEDIFFYTRGGLALDLGSSNRLASVTYGGGDATGGNATCTYSYTNFNDLDVQMRRNGYCGHEHLKGVETQKYGDLPINCLHSIDELGS